MSKIDITKKHQTRDGRQVKLYSDDNKGDYPVHGAIVDEHESYIESWTSEGACHLHTSSGSDLVPVLEKIKIKKTVWFNVYIDGDCHMYSSKVEADDWALDSRVACVQHLVDIEVEI